MAREDVRRALMIVVASAGAVAFAQGVLAQAGTTAPAAAAPTLAGNAAAGKQVFMLQCRVCHTVAKDGPDRRGPNLFGIVGKQAGTDANYTYSDAFKKGDLEVGARCLGGWVTNPGALIAGTAMANFPGVADKDRNNIIAYLATLK